MSENRLFLDQIYVYYKMLDNINIYLNKIIDNNYNGDPYQTEKWFLYISSELMRLFPLRRNKESEQLESSPTDGILLLDKNIPFILEKHNKICSNPCYLEVLNDIVKIRNKFIHEPHNIHFFSSMGSNTSCSMKFKYKSKILSINTISFGSVIYYINKAYKQIDELVFENFNADEKLKSFPIYEDFLNMINNRKKYYYTILLKYIILNY